MDAPTDAAVIEEVAAEGPGWWRISLSPLNQRRWQTFKSHRRGYWSLWIFLILFVISLFAEFIANDRPLLIKYDGHYYFPVFRSYPETAFGGIFETEAVYRDPAVKEMIAQKQRLDRLAADPLLLRHAQQDPADGLSGEADLDADHGGLQACRRAGLPPLQRRARMELARHRRPGPRRRRPRHLRVSHLGAVRPRADLLLVDHRGRGGCGAGLFRRLDRSPVPALHRDLDVACRSSICSSSSPR